jgi:hypothetical protein
MNTDKWDYYYKIDPQEKRLVRSNMLYTPLVNPEKNVLCMKWDANSEYQTKHNEDRDLKKSIDFFFPKEIEYLALFQNNKWAPEILEINEKDKTVFFKWYGETCNNIVYSNQSLNERCPTWKTQLKNIIKDIFNSGYYKMALYPHCFFIDAEQTLRTFDFYSCAAHNSRINFNQIKDMVGPNSKDRFNEVIDGEGYVNVDLLFSRALEKYVVWPDNILQELHKEIFSHV